MHNYTKPCSNCYRARQFITDGFGRLIRRSSTHIQVTTTTGTWLIQVNGNKVVSVPTAEYEQYFGVRVILDAGHIVDVATTRKIVAYSVSRKVTMAA